MDKDKYSREASRSSRRLQPSSVSPSPSRQVAPPLRYESTAPPPARAVQFSVTDPGPISPSADQAQQEHRPAPESEHNSVATEAAAQNSQEQSSEAQPPPHQDSSRRIRRQSTSKPTNSKPTKLVPEELETGELGAKELGAQPSRTHQPRFHPQNSSAP